MVRGTIKLSRPVYNIELDFDKDSLEANGYVRVIRCKDCKHWNDYYRECQSPNWDTGTDDYFVTPAGFYCGWAEREEE